MCCGNYSFYINTEFNYETEVFIREKLNNPIALKEDIIKYKIMTLSKNEIKLKKIRNKVIILKKRKD